MLGLVRKLEEQENYNTRHLSRKNIIKIPGEYTLFFSLSVLTNITPSPPFLLLSPKKQELYEKGEA
jgi:hypothetical protein